MAGFFHDEYFDFLQWQNFLSPQWYCIHESWVIDLSVETDSFWPNFFGRYPPQNFHFNFPIPCRIRSTPEKSNILNFRIWMAISIPHRHSIPLHIFPVKEPTAIEWEPTVVQDVGQPPEFFIPTVTASARKARHPLNMILPSTVWFPVMIPPLTQQFLLW